MKKLISKIAVIALISSIFAVPLSTTSAYTFVGFESTLLNSVTFYGPPADLELTLHSTANVLILDIPEGSIDENGNVEVSTSYKPSGGTELEILVIGYDPGAIIPPATTYHDLMNSTQKWTITPEQMGGSTEIYLLVKGVATNGLTYQEWHRLYVNADVPAVDPQPEPLEPDPWEEYDYPSEADNWTVNPTNKPLFYQFGWPWLRIEKPAKQEVLLNGRLGLGRWVTDDLGPKHRLTDGDDFDSGLALPPSWGGGPADAYCTTGKRMIINKEVNTFEFDIGFEKEISLALLVMYLDEDGSGKYELLNKFGSSEIILWKFVAPPKAGAAGRWAIKIPSRKLNDMTPVMKNHIYGRAYIINLSGPNPPPLPPGLLGDNPQAFEDLNSEALLLAEEVVANQETDEYADLPFPVDDPNMFGVDTEGEVETYCFLPYDKEARDFPSEPERDVPNDGEANEYRPQDLPLIYNHMFFLGHEKDKSELMKEGKIDPPYVTPEITPKTGTRVEAKRVQKIGDDRDGIERRGYILENRTPGEIMLKPGEENTLDIDITVKSSADKNLNILLDQNADGKYEGLDGDTSSEWVLQNMDIDTTDTYEVSIPVRADAGAPNGTYMRVILTDAAVNPTQPWDGDADGFNASSPPQGEAETYYVIFGDPAEDTTDADTTFKNVVLSFADKIEAKGIVFNPLKTIPEVIGDLQNLTVSDAAIQKGCLQNDTPYTFNDIADSPYKNHLKKAGEIGLFEGYDGLFDPGKPIQRDEFAKVVAYSFCIPIVDKDNIATPTFGDVPKDQWSFEVVESLNKAGIMVGYEGNFRPADPVNVIEYYTVLARLAETDQIQDPEMRAEIAAHFAELNSDSWMINGLTFATISELLNPEITGYMDYAHMVTRKETAIGIIGHLMPLIETLE